MNIPPITFYFHCYYNIADELDFALLRGDKVNIPYLRKFIRKLENEDGMVCISTQFCTDIVNDIEKLKKNSFARTPYLNHVKHKLKKWAAIQLFINQNKSKHENAVLQKQRRDRVY